MNRLDARDLLAAVSLANLSFINLWDGLLNYTPAQSFYLDHPPPRTEYAAAFLNVILLGLVFFALIRFARWLAARGRISISTAVLILIALPGGKSLFRLLSNRIPGADLWVVLGMLSFPFAATVIFGRGRFFKLASAALVTISPLLPMELIRTVSLCSNDRSAAFADGPLAPRQPSTSIPRVVWIIFDELDYRLAFVDRPADVPMPAFDRLRTESVFATQAISPFNDTLRSVPSLLAGKQLAEVETKGPATVLFNGVSANLEPTIFSSVRAMGANASVVGWYLPYCRLFSRDVVSCDSHAMEWDLNDTGATLPESLRIQQRTLLAYGHRSLLGESTKSNQRRQILLAMHSSALKAVVDPSSNLVFLHLPVPHAPYLYDRFSHSFPKRTLAVGSYLDNLALADVYLGDLREAMTAAGLWDQTTVLISSDHPDRTSMSVDGKKDPRVPFLLKLAGQTTAITYDQELQTIRTKSLLEAILTQKIKSPESAVAWLRQSSVVRHSQ